MEFVCLDIRRMKVKAKDLSPDLILLNGKVYTLDAEGTTAQAVAVKDGRIAAIGGDAEIRAMAGHGTRHVTLGGRAVIPGIFDSHNHLMEVGAKLSTVRLDVCQSQEEMMELVREQARDTPSGRVDRRPGVEQGQFHRRALADLPGHRSGHRPAPRDPDAVFQHRCGQQ
jgi:hypothetical protein